MKHLVTVFLSCLLSCWAHSQSPTEVIAGMIANRLQDSLLLTNAERDSILQVNLRIAKNKMDKRESGIDGENLRNELQRIENMRDSLYQPYLSPSQFELYLNKKKNLIKGN